MSAPALQVRCVNAHDRCDGGTCPYCEPVMPLRTDDGRFAPMGRRSTDYTTPAARMAPLAEALMRDPNVMCHALIEAMDSIKGRGCRDVIINQINQEARK